MWPNVNKGSHGPISLPTNSLQEPKLDIEDMPLDPPILAFRQILNNPRQKWPTWYVRVPREKRW